MEKRVESPELSRKNSIASRPAAWIASLESWPFALSLLLVLATLAVYYPVHGHQFVNYDDDLCILDNIHVKYGLTWDGVKWAFTTFYFATWVPLSWISHALDCQMFGLNPGWHHDMNLALHAVNVVLLFRVLKRATGYIGRSFMVAALFAVHPINVESVAWVAERRNTLSMLFFLLALGAYRWYAEGSFKFRGSTFEPAPQAASGIADSGKQLTNSKLETQNSKLSFGRYLVVLLLYALGLMSKPQVITLPFILLLWDYWPLGRMFASGEKTSSKAISIPPKSFSWLVVEKLPFLMLAAADAVITMKAGDINRKAALLLRLENVPLSYLRYLGKAFWPARLANLYPLFGNSLKLWQVFAASLALLAVTILVFVARERRYLLVGWVWFLGTAVPMIGLVQIGIQAMADRYAYLPFIGLFIMVCWRVADFHLPPAWLASCSAAVLLMLAMVAHRQVGYWKDSVTLWSHALQVTSGNYQAHDNLASALMEQGQYERALQVLRAGEAIYAYDPLISFHIGLCEQKLGNLPAAIEQYKRAVTLTEGDRQFLRLRRDALQNMGIAYHDLGDVTHAMENLEAATATQQN